MARKAYRRLDRAERNAIEHALDKGKGAREIARELGRSPSTVSEEVARNRTLCRKPRRGERAGAPPADACPRLLSWPHACNGCPQRRRGCGRKWRCEYSAARAQRLADEELSGSRSGVDRGEDEFAEIMEALRVDLGRGLSPAQVAQGRAQEFSVSASTLYRWIERGYAGMSNLDLRRKVGYKPRSRALPARRAAHGAHRSHASFAALADEVRAAACEMDTVVGRARDSKRLLTLYLRPFKLQLALLMESGAACEPPAQLDMLERGLGKEAFRSFFGTVLTDNGAEFSDADAIERSALPGRARRLSLFYCDARQSQQKGGCERNHVELRKLLPKGRGIAFDDLERADMAVVMSHLNSEPRPSLGGLSPIRMLLAARGEAGAELLELLGIEEIPYEGLDLTPRAVGRARAGRGLPPLL